jgi:multiple sugar transport system substrate-binding protein
MQIPLFKRTLALQGKSPLLFFLGALLVSSFLWMLYQSWHAVLGGVPNGKTTLTLSAWGTLEELHTLKTQVHAFEEAHPSLKVHIRHMPDLYTQGLQMLIASNQTPDVMMLNSLDVQRFCQAGLLQDAFSLIKHEQDAFFPTALRSMTAPDGTLCAVPRDVSDLVVYVNQDLLKTLPRHTQALLNPSWHLGDLPAIAEAIANLHRQPKTWTVSFYQAPALFWLPFVWSEGGEVFKNQTIQFNATAVQALAQYKALRHSPHLAPDRQEIGNTTMSDLFLQGRLLCLLSGRWAVPLLRENASFSWDVLPFPQGKAGSRVGIDSTGYAVSRHSPHLKDAQALTRFLSSASAQQAWVHSGLIVPARKALATRDAFLQRGKLPQHADYFITALTTGMPSAYPKTWTHLGQSLNTAMDAYFNTPDFPLEEALKGAQLQGAMPHAS